MKLHQRENGKFKESYAASFKVSAIVALLTAVVFGIIIAIIPLLKIKEEWIEPAQWITGCEGLASCFIVLLAPALNMLVVREQFFWHNLWTVACRSSYLIATVIPFLILQVADLNQGLILFGNIVLIVNVVSTLLLLAGLVFVDKRMLPTIRGATPEAMKKVAGTFGWNSGVVLAMNLHERIANLIMNLFFGLWGNAIFSLALRLVSYIRMMSSKRSRYFFHCFRSSATIKFFRGKCWAKTNVSPQHKNVKFCCVPRNGCCFYNCRTTTSNVGRT
ncbi:MAG TPA: hypothetical protein EYO31_01715 [Phycisphaerales bacterium]|nr:hypothetical protein [Phycisphaerales bacterium]